MVTRSEKGEVIVGLVLGTSSIALGSWLIIAVCNPIVFNPSSISTCQFTGSNGGWIGILMGPIGAVLILASIAVLRGRKHA